MSDAFAVRRFVALLLKCIQRQTRERRDPVADPREVVRRDDDKRAFGDDEFFGRKIAHQKNLACEHAADTIGGVEVRAVILDEQLEAFARHRVADFFLDLAHGALQAGLVTLAVPAEQRDFAGLQNGRDVVALLQQKIAGGVEQNGAADAAGRGHDYSITVLKDRPTLHIFLSEEHSMVIFVQQFLEPLPSA